MKTEYRIVKGDAQYLTTHVNSLLLAGWELHGAPFPTGGKITLYANKSNPNERAEVCELCQALTYSDNRPTCSSEHYSQALMMVQALRAVLSDCLMKTHLDSTEQRMAVQEAIKDADGWLSKVRSNQAKA